MWYIFSVLQKKEIIISSIVHFTKKKEKKRMKMWSPSCTYYYDASYHDGEFCDAHIRRPSKTMLFPRVGKVMLVTLQEPQEQSAKPPWPGAARPQQAKTDSKV